MFLKTKASKCHKRKGKKQKTKRNNSTLDLEGPNIFSPSKLQNPKQTLESPRSSGPNRTNQRTFRFSSLEFARVYFIICTFLCHDSYEYIGESTIESSELNLG